MTTTPLPEQFVIDSDYFGRASLAQLVQPNHNSVAVEVGVHQATFTVEFLKKWPGQYIGIDDWRDYSPEYDKLQHPLPSRLLDMAYSIGRTDRFGHRVSFLKTRSHLAARLLPNNLDLVYIDAGHYSEEVAADIDSWLPKVREGGILAGHDIDYPQAKVQPYRWRTQIEPVLLEKFPNQPIFVLRDRGPWSWYIYKGAA